MRPSRVLVLVLAACLAGASPAAARSAHGSRLDAEAINDAAFSGKTMRGADPALIRAEILLDRQRFSPGQIDGKGGDNVDRAVAAYQRSVGMPETGRLDRATFERLVADPRAAIMPYEITKGDAKGPFTKRIPRRLEDQASLRRLGYRSVQEELAERFHMDERLLRALNPGARFRAGETILVADVTRPRAETKADRLQVAKGERRLRAFAADGTLLARFPASIGSAEKPAPSGSFAVRTVARNPSWTYNPAFGFKGIKADKPIEIPGGPNNPVGAVWIDLTAETYGIHGTPEPRLIGRSFSHGCVRLTNWDALDLAGLVHKGTIVDFVD